MRARHLDPAALEAVDAAGIHWHPVRRALGAEGFGVNAYSAGAGEQLIEEHDEDPGHQELYVVLRGRARFRSDDDAVEAGAGELVFYPEHDIVRGAVALEDGTLALAMGGNVGRPYEKAAWEVWFLAAPMLESGEPEKAAAVLTAGLAEHPDHPRIHLYLAEAQALAGRLDDAMAHLRRAVELDPGEAARRARDELAGALAPLRERPDWPL